VVHILFFCECDNVFDIKNSTNNISYLRYQDFRALISEVSKVNISNFIKAVHYCYSYMSIRYPTPAAWATCPDKSHSVEKHQQPCTFPETSCVTSIFISNSKKLVKTDHTSHHVFDH